MQQIIFPLTGNSLIMALVILVHVFFAFVATGGLVLAFASEWIGYRKNSAFHDRFALGYATFLSSMMKLNGVLGVTIVVLLIGLFPVFTARLYNIFFWPLMLEAAIFMVLMASSIAYRLTWKTAKSKGLHIAIGGLAAAAAIAAALVINAAWSFMLTPGTYFSDPGLIKAVFNPAMPASSIHLVLPCILNAAMFAYIYAFLKLRKAGAADAPYYSWLADYSGTIFAVGILLQPLSGLSFLFTLKAVNAAIFTNIVSGGIAKFFWTMAGLATVAVTASLIYLLSRKKQRAVLLVGGLAALTGFSFGGYTRERARKPFLIYGHMYMTGALVAAAQPAEAAPAVKTEPVKTAPVKPAAKAAPVKAAVPLMTREQGLEKYGCLVCHSYKGEGGTFGPALDQHILHHSKEELKKYLTSPPENMPPFEGTEKELDDLVNALKQD